jgi:hypothetical protein
LHEAGDGIVPTTVEVPDCDAIVVESGHEEAPCCAKGTGESPVAPVPAALGDLGHDAVGAQVVDLPSRAEKIHRARGRLMRRRDRRWPFSSNHGFRDPVRVAAAFVGQADGLRR